MIQAQELRIGNYVYVVKVVPVIVTADHIKSIAQGDTDYTPIPLTPELLEKCGFDYKVNGFNHEFRRGKCDGEYLDFYLLNRHEPASYYELIHVIGKVKLVSKIWHLHQLQNLYFALTGEELEVNL